MRVTSLTLHGFKSFGNRTTIEFAPGVTAIVGPNGSGKSNVIDALKWASGGGRASEFRAAEKTELIFHGAAGKKSLGYAEVEVELRGEGKRLTIFRSLHRDGTGRLRLNGRNARFLDIDEELAGSGLGKNGLAIIGQGEVSGVLMADPTKLLGYVAEVAGVARLAGRRENTEERLATARSHLSRIEDLVLELGRQLERLSAEADEARRHADLSKEALRLRYTVARLREESLRSEIRVLREDRDKLSEEIAGAAQELEKLRHEAERARAVREDTEREYREALAAHEARRGDLRVAQARVEAAHKRREDIAAQLASLQAELAGLARLVEPKPPEGADVTGLDESVRQWRARLEEALARRGAAESAVAEAREKLDRLRERLAAEDRNNAAREARRRALELEVAELREQRGALTRDEVLQQQLSEAENLVEDAVARLRAREQELESLRERLSVAQNEHARAVAEAQSLSRAAERSRQAFEARRGYAEGPRNALASGISGIHGSVADLIRVPRRYREAIAAALGRRLEYVVVEESGTGQQVIDFVRRKSGFVTVLPLDLVRGRDSRSLQGFIGLDGVLGAAEELVEADERFRGVVSQLLGGTLIVEDTQVALAIARRNRDRPRLITLAGDVIESSGAMSGGRRHSGAGVLGAAAELEAAETAAARAREQADECEEGLKRLQASAREQIGLAQSGRQELEEARAELSRLREQAAGRRELEAELERRLERALGELAQFAEAEVPAADQDLEGESRRLMAAEESLVTCRRDVEEAQAALADANRSRDLSSEQQRAYRLALDQYRKDRERRESLAMRRDQLSAESSRAEETLTAAHEDLAAATAALPDDLSDKERALELARQGVREVEARLERQQGLQSGRAEALERLNVTLARREAAWEAASEELRAFPTGVATVDGSERGLRTRLAEITASLEGLGPVNHRAALELEEETRRLTTLRDEARVAEEAIEELSATLVELDRETTSRLEAGVLTLRDGFVRHVRELFGETAEADIEVEREEGRPVGLRIRLQPPGKQTRQLNLLSVGERTMGALAFLFALMSETGDTGLPVAILDEVDAPLDEANIRRYCDFLARLAGRGTQFILITHQKATFEVADAIWGVTTDAGVSRVFSIAKPEAVALG